MISTESYIRNLRRSTNDKEVLTKLFDAGCKTEKDLKALTLPTILKIPDVTVPDMTVITELQEQVAKNRLFSYLGGGTDEPSDTTE